MQKNGYTFAIVYSSKCVSVFLNQTLVLADLKCWCLSKFFERMITMIYDFFHSIDNSGNFQSVKSVIECSMCSKAKTVQRSPTNGLILDASCSIIFFH